MTAQAMELLEVDPDALIVGANVRLDARLDKEFIESIRERGVLEPIVVYRGAGDELVVLRGKRRTMAAVTAGRETVPVVVCPEPEDVDRLVDQLAENDHRTGLATGDHAYAFEQLVALGLPAGQIAKRTATSKTVVEAALKVAASDTAKEVAAKHELDLEEAATIAEFEGDPNAVRILVDAAAHGGFRHQAQRLRDERKLGEEKTKLVDELTAQGVKVLDKPPRYGDPKVADLEYLKVGRKNATEALHKDCPGHAAYLREGWLDNERGWVKHFVCTNWPKHKHTQRYPSTSTTRTPAADMSEEEREAARVERRDVIDSNKAWDSAETVRRDWLRSYLARKSAPKGAALFVADALARCGHALGEALTDGHRYYHEQLDLKLPGYADRGDAIAAGPLAGAPDSRAQMVALGLLLAAYEASTTRDHWRRVNDGTKRYLRFIQSQGYELSDVERRACGEEVKPA